MTLFGYVIDHVIPCYLLSLQLSHFTTTMDSKKNHVEEISKNCKVKNFVQQMKIDNTVKQLILDQLKKKINSHNRQMNMKKGLSKKCVKKSQRKLNKNHDH